jgi:hypothetical protein
MNLASDLKNIEQTVIRIRNTRGKILGQAVEIRKAIKMVRNGYPGSHQQIIDILDLAADVIECELNVNARD